MPVNPNEAPEGFEAVDFEGIHCQKCAMAVEPQRCFFARCMDFERQDKSNVIFRRIRIMATASWPHDDMGTPV